MVVEWAADIDLGVRPIGEAHPMGKRAGQRGTGEDGGSFRPDAAGQYRPDIERGDLEAWVVGASGDEGDVPVVRTEGDVDALLHPGGNLLGAELALLCLEHVGVDRPER